MILPAAKIRELFDVRDGKLFWRTRPLSDFSSESRWKAWNARMAGAECGSELPNGYLAVRVTVDGVLHRLLVHRVIWAHHQGEWPQFQIDHIDHDRKHNRIENLRDVDNRENHRNMSISRRNQSGVTGVGWVRERNRWMAFITIDGRLKNLGHFDEFDDAVSARKAAELRHGFHDNHGVAA